MLLCWFLIGLGAALIPSISAPNQSLQSEPAEIEIGLIHSPWHSDLLLPLTDDLRQKFDFATKGGIGIHHPQAGWLLVGWGAAGLYQTPLSLSAPPSGAIFNALTGDKSLVRLEARLDHPLPDFGAQSLRISQSGYEALLAYILAEIDHPQLVRAPALTETDAFYAGKSRFHPGRTSAAWTGQALRRAGVRLGLWTPSVLALRLSLAAHHR